MPKSSLDALSLELEEFQKSLSQFHQLVDQAQKPVEHHKNLAAKMDDLENIVVTAFALAPHISLKARAAFNDLKSSLGNAFQQNPEILFQTCNRLDFMAESIVRRVNAILKVDDATGNHADGIILAQEEERKRISREIHDGPAQTLASLTMRIDYCLEQPDVSQTIVEELKNLKESVIRSLKDIRRYIFDLRPMALDDLGLIPTLEQFINGFKGRTGVPVYVDVEGERVIIGGDRELAVFRVIQEASNNAIRHAEPSSVHIFLKFDERKNRLSVAIKDDGHGFDVSATRKNYASMKKLGLVSMEERVRLAGGEFQIVSDPGTGTVVSFWIPFR
ncbi:MAG: sensor histidine kinase [Candidatus Riflebacteria bacterium]|nr:sensor histidine kinase [Candidatus Riflebacteria bacterium]